MRELTDIIHDADIEAAAGSLHASTDTGCPICGGSGYILLPNGTAGRCKCWRQRQMLMAQKLARIQPALRTKSFKNFDLSCYPAGEIAPNCKGQTYYALAKQALDKATGLCSAVINGGAPRGLLLLGQVGSGKTHLAAAMANCLLARGHKVLFLVVPDFLDELRDSFSGVGGAAEPSLLDMAKRAEVLMLDDLGSHNLTDWTKSVLFSVLNYRVNEGLTTIATSNLNITALQEALGERAMSRLLGLCEVGLLVTVEDLRLRKPEVQ